MWHPEVTLRRSEPVKQSRLVKGILKIIERLAGMNPKSSHELVVGSCCSKFPREGNAFLSRRDEWIMWSMKTML